MFKLYKFTDSEVKTLLQSMIILIDSREQKNSHITNYFDKKNIPYRTTALKIGDYSFVLPKNSDLGIPKDLYFDSEIVIERKNSLEELSNNLTAKREQFERELSRFKGKSFILMIENSRLSDIFTHSYNTKILPKAFLASLMSYQFRYGIQTTYVDAGLAGSYIIGVFNYFLREYLKDS